MDTRRFLLRCETLADSDLRQPITESWDSEGFMHQLGVHPHATCMFWAGTARQIREHFDSLLLKQLNRELLHFEDNTLWRDRQATAVKAIGVDTFLATSFNAPAAVWGFSLTWTNRWIARFGGGGFEALAASASPPYVDFPPSARPPRPLCPHRPTTAPSSRPTPQLLCQSITRLPI